MEPRTEEVPYGNGCGRDAPKTSLSFPALKRDSTTGVSFQRTNWSINCLTAKDECWQASM